MKKHILYWAYMLIWLISLFIPLSAIAQKAQDTIAAPVINNQPPIVTVAPITKIPRVIKIQTVYASEEQQQNEKMNRRTTAFPDNTLRFTISNPDAFLRAKPTDNARVVIYANGVELNGICNSWYRNVTRLDINSGQLPAFGSTAYIDVKLLRNDTTQAAWNFFYSGGRHFWSNYADIDASIGWEGMSALERDPSLRAVRIVYYQQWIFWGWLGLYGIILIFFLLIARKSDALKERPDGPYSLSYTQLLFWTVLIIGGFIYTMVLTDITNSLNTSILLLLGISIGTTGSASAIDTAFNQNNPPASDKRSVSFFYDILSDGNSYSIPRIQTFAWNLVLGLYFIVYTIVHKAMPVFSDTLLFLAGFSSVSYLGAKLPENINAKNTAQVQLTKPTNKKNAATDQAEK
jgi:hypothetical protein